MKLTYFEIFYQHASTNETFASDFRWKDVEQFCEANNLCVPAPNHLKPFRMERGVYSFNKEDHGVDLNAILNPSIVQNTQLSVVAEPKPVKINENFIPPISKYYVPFGVAEDVETVISSGRYMSTFITGDTGYGKTFIVRQICAKLGREVIRVNCTPFTTEDELIGHYALENGNTVWKDGPVLFALKRGAILLLDEADALDPKRGAFCLFPLLEGEGVYVKKLNKHFMPKDGFNIIATANTKGKGDNRGRHAGVNVQNEAFLDRFKLTLEHKHPSVETEAKILKLVDTQNDDDFINKVVHWTNTIRKTYEADACDEVISTRRACDIIEMYAIFQSRLKVINHATTKFDDETKESFIDLYMKIDANPDVVKEFENETEEYPF